MDLFEAASPEHEPLAARMRPRSMEEFVGQEHLISPGRLLRRAIDADQISSLIFHGPPGTGKTTLARVIANTTKSHFLSLNAVLSGVKDIRKAIDEAQEKNTYTQIRTLLFVDEVHRWNKSQQDALLPWVENGTVVLIGATTENPYFEVNKALVSRSRVFQLRKLEKQQLQKIAEQSLHDSSRGYGQWNVQFEEGALEHLVHISAGDARSLLNALQLAVEGSVPSFPPEPGTSIKVSLFAAEESIQEKVLLYDKEGDYHFDTISAFIKSLRGSDPDAALYWMALMIRAGENPRYIFRRMLVSASEDVGLAAPEALGIIESCAAAFDRVGLPEGQFHLAQAALYLSTCPKSHSTLGYFDALEALQTEEINDMPPHLRDSSRDKEALGHGKNYQYPHAWREHWVAQQYLPESLTGRLFYQPNSLGYEGKIRDQVIRRREEQVAFLLENKEESPLVSSYSPGDKERERWVKRSEIGKDTLGIKRRDLMLHHWKPARQDCVLIVADPAHTLLWEAQRRVPEGGVSMLCHQEKSYQALSWMSQGLAPIERPQLIQGTLASPKIQEKLSEKDQRYESILGQNFLALLTDKESKQNLLDQTQKLAAAGGLLLLAEPCPNKGTKISDLIPPSLCQDPTLQAFCQAESRLHESLAKENQSTSIPELFSHSSWHNLEIEDKELEENRLLSPSLLESWFDSQRKGSYAFKMASLLEENMWQKIRTQLKTVLTGRRVPWHSSFLLIKARNLLR